MECQQYGRFIILPEDMAVDRELRGFWTGWGRHREPSHQVQWRGFVYIFDCPSVSQLPSTDLKELSYTASLAPRTTHRGAEPPRSGLVLSGIQTHILN